MMTDTTSQYRNALHCAAVVLKNEGELFFVSRAPNFDAHASPRAGPLAFYKGFTMCFLRLWPHSVLSLLAFERLRNLAGIAPI
jgi:hypothetical protein